MFFFSSFINLPDFESKANLIAPLDALSRVVSCFGAALRACGGGGGGRWKGAVEGR